MEILTAVALYFLCGLATAIVYRIISNVTYLYDTPDASQMTACFFLWPLWVGIGIVCAVVIPVHWFFRLLS